MKKCEHDYVYKKKHGKEYMYECSECSKVIYLKKGIEYVTDMPTKPVFIDLNGWLGL